MPNSAVGGLPRIRSHCNTTPRESHIGGGCWINQAKVLCNFVVPAKSFEHVPGKEVRFAWKVEFRCSGAISEYPVTGNRAARSWFMQRGTCPHSGFGRGCDSAATPTTPWGSSDIASTCVRPIGALLDRTKRRTQSFSDAPWKTTRARGKPQRSRVVGSMAMDPGPVGSKARMMDLAT